MKIQKQENMKKYERIKEKYLSIHQKIFDLKKEIISFKSKLTSSQDLITFHEKKIKFHNKKIKDISNEKNKKIILDRFYYKSKNWFKKILDFLKGGAENEIFEKGYFKRFNGKKIVEFELQNMIIIKGGIDKDFVQLKFNSEETNQVTSAVIYGQRDDENDQFQITKLEKNIQTCLGIIKDENNNIVKFERKIKNLENRMRLLQKQKKVVKNDYQIKIGKFTQQNQ